MSTERFNYVQMYIMLMYYVERSLLRALILDKYTAFSLQKSESEWMYLTFEFLKRFIRNIIIIQNINDDIEKSVVNSKRLIASFSLPMT